MIFFMKEKLFITVVKIVKNWKGRFYDNFTSVRDIRIIYEFQDLKRIHL